GEDIERIWRSVREDRAELESAGNPRPDGSVSLRARYTKLTAQREPMALVIVGKTAVVADVEVVLRRTEKSVSRIVDRFRQRVRHSDIRPTCSAVFRRQSQPVIVGVALSAVLVDVCEVRVGTAQVH